MSDHSGHASGYPPQGVPAHSAGAYPSGYPPAHQGYPPASPGYPPAQPGYPPASAGYPPAQPGYSPVSPGYPPSQPGYPPASTGYPPAQHGYPPASTGYPPSQPGYPPASQGYPSSPQQYPGFPPSSGYPPATHADGCYPPPQSAQPGAYTPGQPVQHSQGSAPPLSATQGAYPHPPPSSGHPPAQPGYNAVPPHGYPPSSAPSAPPASAPGHPPSASGGPCAPSNVAQPIPVVPEPQGKPTVVEVRPFLPVEDAKDLRKAMKGLGTDNKVLINILAYRNLSQRLQIKDAFYNTLQRDLLKDLRSETSGSFDIILQDLFQPPDVYDAECLRNAMKGVGTNETALTEILCTRSNAEIKKIKETYHRLYNRHLDVDVRSETSGDYRGLLLRILTATRNETAPSDSNQVAEDSKRLYNAGANRIGTDESVFEEIFATRSYTHLRAVFEDYRKRYHKDIEDAISSEFSGDAAVAYKSLVRFLRNRPAYFAERLREALTGTVVDDTSITRIVVSRCERDLEDIKAAYLKHHREHLGQTIAGATMGNYQKTLLALIRH